MNPTIDLHYDLITQHCLVFKSESSIRSSNRVCHTNIPTDDEIQTIKSFFGETPFTWAVNITDAESITTLEKNSLKHIASFPAMHFNLNDFDHYSQEDTFVIKEINLNNDTDITTWISIPAQSFQIAQPELLKVIHLFKKRIPHALKLYIGYDQDKIVAAGMMILHKETATLHWICTLPEYRNKGLGSAMTHKALIDAKKNGCTQAILLSSVLGKHVYERIGFKEYATYAMYGN